MNLRDPAEYSFNAQIWGTVSDWAMIIVTGITAFFIWRTLRSQIQVQRLQQRIAQMHEYDFIEKIKPVFTLGEDSLREVESEERLGEFSMFLRLILLKEDADEVIFNQSFTL